MKVMKSVHKTYDNGETALSDINMYIDTGEFIYIVGQNGARISSLIKRIYREEKPTKGSVIINNKNVNDLKEKHVSFLRRDIGVIFQDFKLLPRLTVYENVAYALEVIEAPRRNIRQRVMTV